MNVLHTPSFRTIFLTAWGESHSYNPCNPLDPRSDQHLQKLYLKNGFYLDAANREKMREEYAELTYRLYRIFAGTGKVFAISNWEGDNELYCGSAWYFATNSSFRSNCNKERATSDVFDAYRTFLGLRQEGIDLGRERALASGFRDVTVASVVEISALHFLREKHLPNMLDDVMPDIPPSDYVSYSAWESIGSPQALRRDLVELRARFGSRLVVGEFGFDRGLDSAAPEHLALAMKIMCHARLSYVIWWQILDQPPLAGLGDKGLYGLYDRNATLTPFGEEFNVLFQRLPKNTNCHDWRSE